MNSTHLTGLEGTNPMGFLAAIGVQTAFSDEDMQPYLWWSDDVTPHAMVDDRFGVERITDQLLDSAARWKGSISTNPKRPDGSLIPKTFLWLPNIRRSRIGRQIPALAAVLGALPGVRSL